MYRNNWIDHLRAFITILVVAHHSSLAYTTFAYFNNAAYITSTHPVVDAARWEGMDLFVGFNDIFFMSLMFLISGLFMAPSLDRKGRRVFIKDRLYRLFIPFIIGVTILMLLAYYPAYRLAHGSGDLAGYIIDFFTVEAWPVGPPWFIWVLFFFNLVFAVFYPFIRRPLRHLGHRLQSMGGRPLGVFLVWWLVTWLCYVPIVIFLAGPYVWTGWGPFDFQVSRMLLYAGYFLLGAVIGSQRMDTGIFGKESILVKRWYVWMIAALGTFVFLRSVKMPLLISLSVWTLSCTLSCLAFLTFFRRLFRSASFIWGSLSANAYGIYLVHYIFVVWCQYLLLLFDWPVVPKFILTFITGAGLSWLVTYVARKNTVVRRYL